MKMLFWRLGQDWIIKLFYRQQVNVQCEIIIAIWLASLNFKCIMNHNVSFYRSIYFSGVLNGPELEISNLPQTKLGSLPSPDQTEWLIWFFYHPPKSGFLPDSSYWAPSQWKFQHVICNWKEWICPSLIFQAKWTVAELELIENSLLHWTFVWCDWTVAQQ